MIKLGRFIQGQGSIPAGGDANIVHRIFTAGNKPVLVTAGGYWGGDAGEYIVIGMVSPSMNSSLGAKEWSDFLESGNGIPILTGNLEGAVTANGSQSLFGAFLRTSMNGQFILPPNYSFVMWANAANAAAWYCTVAGFECEGY